MASTKGQSKALGDSELLLRLERMAARDLADDVAGMSDKEVATALRSEGADPDAIGARGASFMNALLDRRSGEAPPWKASAAARGEAAREAAKKAPKVASSGLPRSELLARIEAARKDSRLGATVAAAFRSRTAAESSDKELASLVDELAELTAIAEAATRTAPATSPKAQKAKPKKKTKKR